MVKKQSSQTVWLQDTAVRAARVHFYLVFIYAAYIIANDAWKLITSQALLERWTVATIMLVTTTAVWAISRQPNLKAIYYKLLIFALIAVDIYFAVFSVYTQRGMASRGVALFAIPIVVSALLLSRGLLFGVAALCVGAYSLTAIRYFVENPSEGYKVELYGEVGLYCALFFLLASLLWVLIRPKA